MKYIKKFENRHFSLKMKELLEDELSKYLELSTDVEMLDKSTRYWDILLKTSIFLLEDDYGIIVRYFDNNVKIDTIYKVGNKFKEGSFIKFIDYTKVSIKLLVVDVIKELKKKNLIRKKSKETKSIRKNADKYNL